MNDGHFCSPICLIGGSIKLMPNSLNASIEDGVTLGQHVDIKKLGSEYS
jgi:hypothetical protein